MGVADFSHMTKAKRATNCGRAAAQTVDCTVCLRDVSSDFMDCELCGHK